MKKIFKIAGSVVAGLLIVAALAITPTLTGCSTVKGAAGSVITDTNTINTVSTYLTEAVAYAVSYGITQDTNTVKYANLADAAIGEVLGGTDLTPAALDSAIQNLPVAVLSTPTAGVITLSIESLYQIYWSSDVSGAVNGDYAARTYLQAVRAGIKQGEAGKSATPLHKLVRPAVHSH